jgi:hypothetical protein
MTGYEVLLGLARAVREDGGLLAQAVRDPAGDALAPHGTTTARGPRAVGREADLALGGARSIDVVTPPPGGGVAAPATFTVVGPTLTLDRTTAGPAGPVTATFSNGPGQLSDWLGVFPVAGGDFVDWQWASGGRSGAQPRTSGAVTFPTGGGTLAPGTYVVRWMSGGQIAQSVAFTLAEIPPAPALERLDPGHLVAGGGPQTLRVVGSGFRASSVVRLGGVVRATTFVSATELTTTLTAGDASVAGTQHEVTVSTPALSGVGGRDSAVLTLAVVTGPTLVLDRTTAPLAGPVTLTFAQGPGRGGEWIGVFPAAGGSYADWQWVSGGQANSQARTAGTLTFPTNGRALTPGAYVLRWLSGSQVVQSASVTLADVAPAPALASLDPGSIVAGTGAQTLRVIGRGFTATSAIRFDGGPRTTTFVSATELTTALGANETVTAGTSYAVVVSTPVIGGAGGGDSSAATLAIVAPPAAPTVESIAPASVAAGGASPTLMLRGTAFAGTSRVRVDGAERPTTFVSVTELRVTLPAADVASGGTRAITVATPAPGGGTSNAATLTVVGPSITLDRTTAPATESVTATFANGPGGGGEWIGVFPAAGGSHVDWGGQSTPQWRTGGALTFPTTGRVLAPGVYVLRWIGGGQLAESVTLTLVDGPAPALTLSVNAGTIAVSFANGRGTGGEWVGVFPATTSGAGAATSTGSGSRAARTARGSRRPER